MAARRFDMPFGAQLTRDGVRFRLWAPGARRVDVVLDPRGANRLNLPELALDGTLRALRSAPAGSSGAAGAGLFHLCQSV